MNTPRNFTGASPFFLALEVAGQLDRRSGDPTIHFVWTAELQATLGQPVLYLAKCRFVESLVLHMRKHGVAGFGLFDNILHDTGT